MRRGRAPDAARAPAGRLVTAGTLAFALGAGCALPPAEWDVPRGSESRFAEARKACVALTTPGSPRFDDCMERRGFERESLAKRGWRAVTGG